MSKVSEAPQGAEADYVLELTERELEALKDAVARDGNGTARQVLGMGWSE